MNEAQRSVLQRHFRQLASDLILTEDFIGMLYQHRIFERNMIEIIKVLPYCMLIKGHSFILRNCQQKIGKILFQVSKLFLSHDKK